MRESARVHFRSKVTLLSTHPGNLLVQLLGDFDKASTIDFAIPLELSEQTTELEKGVHKISNLIFIQSIGNLRGSPIATVEQFQTSRELGILLVIEAIDILEISIESKEKS